MHHATDRFSFTAYLTKLRTDNIFFLIAALAWSMFMSVVPIVIGMIAVAGLMFQGASQQRAIVHQLSRALQGVLSSKYLEHLVSIIVRQSRLSLLIAVLTIAWCVEHISFGLTWTFAALFEVRPRPFLQARLIHLAMFFAFLGLMLLIVVETAGRATMDHTLPPSLARNLVKLPVTTAISVSAAFVLFILIYSVYPNIQTRLKLRHVWRGALLAAILFQLLTYLWPMYAAYLSQYGGILFPIMVLALWIYFFATVLVLGAEVVAVGAIREADQRGEEVGPSHDGATPQCDPVRDHESPSARIASDA